jgi:hypothetical protein
MRGMMMLAAAAVTAVVGLASAGREAQARDYAYCAVAGGRDGYENCGYSSLRQCLASVSGVGGHCQPNPRYGAGYGPSYGPAAYAPHGAYDGPRVHRRHHHHRRHHAHHRHHRH